MYVKTSKKAFITEVYYRGEHRWSYTSVIKKQQLGSVYFSKVRLSCSRIGSLSQILRKTKTPLISQQGAASADEFYAKNSRWTEGLISASKAVGWGATQILYVFTHNPLFKTRFLWDWRVFLLVILIISLLPRESADRVVSHNGKYEELIACSHEIAASTAQLVASSKVAFSLPSHYITTCSLTVSLHYNMFTSVSLHNNMFTSVSLHCNMFTSVSLHYNMFTTISLHFNIFNTDNYISISLLIFRACRFIQFPSNQIMVFTQHFNHSTHSHQ